MAVRATIAYYKEKATKAHEGRYDYSLWPTEWVPSSTKVKIICPEHGEFEQQISVHARGAGCRKCSTIKSGLRKSKGRDFYLSKAVKHHGDKYDYSLVPVNVHSLDNVTIICPEHGEFEQRMERHASGSGCNECGISRTYTGRQKRLDRCSEVHDGKYDYSLWPETVTAKSKVEIVCPDHGIFTQQVSSHQFGQGCPKCSLGGFDGTSEGYAYLLRSDCGQFMKVGVTKNTKRRFKELKDATPFIFSPIAVVYFERGGHALAIEKSVREFCVSANFSGFNGATEWYIYDDTVYDVISTM